jgi:multidrug efflux pump subunit AcrA (membrane-fusion protein)
MAALLALFAITALVVAGVVTGLVSRQRERAALVNETAELAVPTVTVVSPAPGKAAATLLLPAEVKPWIDAPIYARASGYVKRWLVDIGAPVKAGELLAEIETPELDQQVDQARHELAQAEAALALAKSTAERYTLLLKTASVSEQDADEKQSDFALKTASAAADRANLRRLENLQAFARVTAPFAGTITARNIDVGELVAAGNAKELFRLSQTDKLRVYVSVPQTDAFSVRADQPAEMLIPEFPVGSSPRRWCPPPALSPPTRARCSPNWKWTIHATTFCRAVLPKCGSRRRNARPAWCSRRTPCCSAPKDRRWAS